MASYYTVVQFLPDPLADERINIGVIAYGDGDVEVKFIEDWGRVRSFWGRSPSALRIVAQEIQEAALSVPGIGADELERVVADWSRSVQFTSPRASLLAPDSLVTQISATMLKEPRHTKRAVTKATVVRQARLSLEREIREVVETQGDVDELVRSRDIIRGLVEPHQMDLAVRNGHVMVAAQAIAFPKETSAHVQQQIAATAWALKDISESEDGPSLAVIVAPPADLKRDDYVRASNVFGDLNAELVMAGKVDDWAHSVAEKVQRELVDSWTENRT